MKRVLYGIIAAGLLAGCAGSRGVSDTLDGFWGREDFAAQTAFADLPAAQDKFDRWCSLLDRADSTEALTALLAFADSVKTDPVANNIYSSWIREALHDPLSPHRSDFLFLPWLDKVLEDAALDDWILDLLRNTAQVAGHFVVGQPAADFTVADADGQEFSPTDFRGAPLVLVFLDAECPSCTDFVEAVDAELIRRGTDAARLAVFSASSPEHAAAMRQVLPGGWIAAWSPSRALERGEVYDLTLLPSALIIGPDGRVDTYLNP